MEKMLRARKGANCQKGSVAPKGSPRFLGSNAIFASVAPLEKLIQGSASMQDFIAE